MVYSPSITYLQYIHDLCLVRPSQAQVHKPDHSYTGQLGNRLLRVLLPGACQPPGLPVLHHCPAEDHTGGHFTFCILSLLCALPAGGVQVELSCSLPVHSCGCNTGHEKIIACRLTDSGTETIF